MDHAYLETTVAPVLTDALTDLSLRFAGTHASTKGQAHPTIDPIDFIAKYLLRSLAAPKWEDPLKADEERRAGMRDAVLTHAQDEQLRKTKDAEDKARAEAAKSVASASVAQEAASEPQQVKLEGDAVAQASAASEVVPAIQVTEDAQQQQQQQQAGGDPAASAAVDGAPAAAASGGADAVALPSDAGEEI